MQMRKEVFALAITGLFLIATSAFALDGSSPVDVSNGDVSLSCSDNNRILGKASGSVSCLDDIPDYVSQNAVMVGDYANLLAQRYYLGGFIRVGSTNYLYTVQDDPDDVVGVIEYPDGDTPGSPYLVTSGNVTIAKQDDNSIAAGDRVKLDGRGFAGTTVVGSTSGSCINFAGFRWCGKVMTAAANEKAVGIATAAAATSDTTVEVLLGASVVPPDISGTGAISVSSSNVISFTGSTGVAQNAVRHVAFMQNLTSVSSNADEYFPAIGVGKNLHVSSVQAQTPTVFPSGAIVDGIVCNCDAAPASGKTVKFRLCKKSVSNNCHETSPDGSDMISQCTVTDSTTTCTDTDFSGTSSLSTNDKLYYYIERDGGGDCNFYSCRFPYTQSEY